MLLGINQRAEEIFKEAGSIVRTHKGSLDRERLKKEIADVDIIGIRCVAAL